MELSLNTYITLWILFAVVITMTDDSVGERQIIYWCIISVLSIIWIESSLGGMNLSMSGIFVSSNGLLNLRSYLP